MVYSPGSTVYEALEIAPPTASPTLPSMMSPTTSPTAKPTVPPARYNITNFQLLSESPFPLVSNVQQLFLGYNSLLGLTPYEQQGVYMRNPIFQFHLSSNNAFLLMEGQSGASAKFSTPM